MDELRYRLGAAAQAYQSAVDALDESVAEHLGINRTDLRCLDLLWQAGSLTPGVLGTRLGLTTGSVTAMLDRLARLGYLTRSPDPGDRRRVVVTLTDQAKERAWRIYGPIVREGAAGVEAYTEQELRLLIGFLEGGAELQEKHRRRIRDLP
ncbi:MarR family transcriptional regulator [Kibdelosporangium lantanae]